MLATWSLVPMSFLNPAWTSGSSRFMYCWSLAWRISSICLLACETSAIVQYFEHSLALGVNTYFISQSSPDIWKKLKKVEEGPQTPQWDLLNLAFKIFNNQEEQASLEKDQGDQAKRHLWLKATVLHGSTFPSTKTGSHLGPASNAERRSLGPLMPKAEASTRSVSQLWHKATLEGQLPKSPSRVLDILSWSWAGVLWPNSAQPPWTRYWKLKVSRAPGPDAHHLYGAQGNSHSGI